MTLNRRDFVRRALFGAGGLGLRALATGLPAALLANPLRALAAQAPASIPQFMLLSTSYAGDPTNVYAPGSWLPNVSRSTDPFMAAASVSIGGNAYQVGGAWASLPTRFYQRVSFFHHATGTISHSDNLKVLALMGAVRRGENIVSIFSGALQPLLGTLSADPVAMDAEGVTAAGRPLARLSPSGLKTSLISSPGPLLDLRPLRDETMDAMHKLYKSVGSPSQRDFMDKMAKSRSDARSISDAVVGGLESLSGDDVNNEILAAILLFKMNITPAAMVHLNFGGDNHSDTVLAGETAAHRSAIGSMSNMLTLLDTWGLADQVTFVTLNIFGRSLMSSDNGRGHHGGHNVGIIYGKNVLPSVVGGLTTNNSGGAVITQNNSDYIAQTINSTTGAADASGDISLNDSLGAFGQTVGAALGLPADFLSTNITQGKVVKAAVTSS